MIEGLGLFILGATIVLGAEKRAADARRRMRSGEDTYFEEQRELEAYPLLRSPKMMRNLGWGVIAVAIFVLAIDVFRYA